MRARAPNVAVSALACPANPGTRSITGFSSWCERGLACVRAAVTLSRCAADGGREARARRHTIGISWAFLRAGAAGAQDIPRASPSPGRAANAPRDEPRRHPAGHDVQTRAAGGTPAIPDLPPRGVGTGSGWVVRDLVGDPAGSGRQPKIRVGGQEPGRRSGRVRVGGGAGPGQEVEVAALVGLGDVLAEQRPVAALVPGRWRVPLLAAAGQLGVGDLEAQRPGRDVEGRSGRRCAPGPAARRRRTRATTCSTQAP